MTIQFAQRLDGVEASAIRELFKLLGRPGIISFAGGFPDSSNFDVEGIRAASDAALRDNPAAALQYGATEGYDPLRIQLARLMEERGVPQARADRLVVTTGSQQGLDLLGKALIDPEDKVIVEGATFLAAIQCFRLYGAQIVAAPADENGVKPEALEALIAEHKPKLVYLVPSFGNPTGSLLTLERRLQVLALAVRHKTLVVEDDPYGDLYFDLPPPPSLLALSDQVPGSGDWVAYCGSLSKVVSPGLRIGWLVAPAPLLQKATMCKQFADAHTSTFAQATAAHYLESGRLGRALDAVRSVYRGRARCMGEMLREHLGDEVRFAPPRGGMFIWCELAGARWADASVLARAAIEEGVAFVPGAPFQAGVPVKRMFRLSFATVDADAIDFGVRRLAAAIRKGPMPSASVVRGLSGAQA